MVDIEYQDVRSDHNLTIPVVSGATAVVTVVSGSTLYYSNADRNVTPGNAQGTLSAGQSATFSSTYWVGSLSLTAISILNSGAVAGGGGAISSVFGRTGVVAATAGDYSAAQVTGVEATANKGAVSGYAGLDAGQLVPAANSRVQSLFGRTGVVAAQAGDYTAAQVGAQPGFGARTVVLVATGDVQQVIDGAMTSGSPIITTARVFTAGDVGKRIEVDGAGTAGATLVTTVQSVATGVPTLATNAITNISQARVKWGTDSGAALTAALASVGAQGSVLIAPGTYFIDPVTLIDGQTLAGLSRGFVGRLLLKAGSNADIITNALTGVNLASRLTVSDLFLDGNKGGQTSGHGIHWVGSSTDFANDWDLQYDVYNTVNNVLVYRAKNDGYHADLGRSTNFLNHVYVRYCDGHGFAPTYDTWMTGCDAGTSGLNGFNIVNGPVHLANCKAWYSGQIGYGSNQGYGFSFTGVPDGTLATGCIAQDNQLAGFTITNARVTLTGCVADSNSKVGAGGVGFDLWAANYCTITGCFAWDRRTSGQPNAHGNTTDQVTPVRVRGTSTHNVIEINYRGGGGTEGQVAPDPTASDGSLLLSNRIVLGNQLGLQSVAYAATVTPDPFQGGTIIITLTGNITVANTIGAAFGGPHPGVEMEFQFLQDATGTRTVTWGTQYKLGTWTPDTTANKVNTIRFRWDGAAWRHVAGVTGIAA